MREQDQEGIKVEQLKSCVSFPQLMEHYGFRIGRDHKILCPFHHEKTSSFHVYEERGLCYGGCGWHGDIIQFVMDRESVYFGKALELIAGWFKVSKDAPLQPATKVKDVPKKLRVEPINPEIVNYFHGELTVERRSWLHEKRLLTDESIDFLKMGWRPDLDAYSIPFWKGVPGYSEVEVMQFRYAPQEGRKARYISLDNHGFAGLVGRYTINPEFLVVMVGTLDVVLANQDGIPAISPNGLTVWKNRLEELRWIVGDVKELFLVPDNTTSETIESTRLANELGAKIRYLPQMEEGKDYTDYRLLGNSPKQFIEEVLRVSSSPFITNEDHIQTIRDILDCISDGDGEKALELLDILQLNGYAWYSVFNKLILFVSMYPAKEFGHEWATFVHELSLSRSYDSMAQVIKDTAESLRGSGGQF